jgi:hypothetical protein
MDTAITVTPADVVTYFLGICGAIAVIGQAAKWIVEAIQTIRKPETKQNENIEKLEARVTNVESKVLQFEGYFKNDQDQLSELLEGMRVLQRVNLALLSHAIHGNDIDSLKEEEHELQEYLTRKEK